MQEPSGVKFIYQKGAYAKHRMSDIPTGSYSTYLRVRLLQGGHGLKQLQALLLQSGQ